MLAVIQDPMGLLVLCTMLGLLVGSFLNVVIYRVPAMLQRGWRQECAAMLESKGLNVDAILEPDDKERFDLISPGSHCPKCNADIKPWQNIPVISYLIQGRACVSCKAPISARYPLVELATALLSLLVAWHFGSTLACGFALILCWYLIALTMIDIDHQLLPDSMTLPLIWIGLIANSFGCFTDLESALWGAVLGYGSLWSVFWLFKLLTGKDGMGYGDFKLLAALGAWLGWQMVPLVIILSSLVGAVLGSLMLLRSDQDKSTPIPFGPYLAMAGGIALIWGEPILEAYKRFSGL